MKRNTIEIAPRAPLSVAWLQEAWRARELVVFWAWRDVQIRYKQTALGPLWAVLPPVLNMVIFVVLFGRLARLPSDGLPSSVFYLSGLVIWRYFSSAFNGASGALLENAAMIKKVYFPRIVLVLKSAFTFTADFAINFALLCGVLVFYGLSPSWWILAIPMLLVATGIVAISFGMMVAGLSTKFRDIRLAVPFISNVWMYCTVVVPFSRISEDWGPWKYAYGVNPMGGIVEAFRFCLFGLAHGEPRDFSLYPLLGISATVTVLIGLAGLLVFSRAEAEAADVL